MICKGCKAVEGDRHPSDVSDFTSAKCKLGYQTMLDRGMMMPVYKCEKPKTWKALNRLLTGKLTELQELMCDSYCKWPVISNDQDELNDRCNDCQKIKLWNFVNKGESD